MGYLVKLLLGVLVIPLIGMAVSVARFWDFSSVDTLQLAGLTVWEAGLALVKQEPAGLSGDETLFVWLGVASVGVLATAIVLGLLVRIVAPVLGIHRSLLAFIFPWIAGLATLIIGAIALAHYAILVGAVYLGLQHWAGIDGSLALGVMGAMGVAIAISLINALRAFFVRPKSHVAARPVSLYEFPRLGLMVREVAKTVKARMPDNVVMGLDPTFYVTSAPVQTPYMAEPLKGETLHLSIPLMERFTPAEFRAVLGHELGHFAGGDTAYSLRFAPVYIGVGATRAALSDPGRPITRWVTLPARVLIEDFLRVFAAQERRIGRGRERRADRLGAKAASEEDIAFSLLKASIFSAVWGDEFRDSIARARKGRFSRNLVRNFADRVKYDVDRSKITPLLKFALGDHVAHPTDTHPSTEDRMTALGLSFEEIVREDRIQRRFFKTEGVLPTLDNMTALEEDLTALHYHITEPHWRPDMPEEKDNQELFLMVSADFLALMVTIDGEVDDREIEAAETRAVQLFGDIDRERFRERCRHPEDLPELDRMVDFAGRLLNETGIDNLKTILRAIAEADGRLDEKEAELLARIDADLVMIEGE
jgi:Zn-dependent protease with chaperone function/uncharacterized tellurite resistance protein B-like protein